jgi:SAM-dependent MidA family methyltransferase
MRWREAMGLALYGPNGFFTRPSAGPAGHFRTSAHASPLFAAALARLLVRLDGALGHPARLDVVDIGAGRAELLRGLLAALPENVAVRVRPTAVELAPRPPDLPPDIDWVAQPPAGTVGLLLSTEWLDNVPIDIATVDGTGRARYVLVDPAGNERLGPPIDPADAQWLATWWPLETVPRGTRPPGARAEVGAGRDAAWAAAVSTIGRGLAVTVDYGHLRGGRPAFGTLTGFQAGRQVYPVPDGSCDLTAHVAFDAVALAGASVAGLPPSLLGQRAVLQSLGVTGQRPPLEGAHEDPGAYVRALAQASVAAELIDPDGLGGHYWLLQPVGIDSSILGVTNRHTVS